jgi:hypothetical protein
VHTHHPCCRMRCELGGEVRAGPNEWNEGNHAPLSTALSTTAVLSSVPHPCWRLCSRGRVTAANCCC